MNLLRELRRRRVPQYVSAYVIGGWGVLQFLEFLEGRLRFSPHLVNLVGLGLLLLLPGVFLLAWSLGRPGPDPRTRLLKVGVPVNVVAVALVLLVVFHDKDLGALTTTVQARDENGQVFEREVPRQAYRKRLALFALDGPAAGPDAWLRHGVPLLLGFDLAQDPFLDVRGPVSMADVLAEAQHADGLDLPRPLQRKIARDLHLGSFLTGSVRRDDGRLVLDCQLHDSERGDVLAEISLAGEQVLPLLDDLSRRIREHLGLPSGHLEEQEDLPLAEITSEVPAAIPPFCRGVIAASLDNDWEAARRLLGEAVAADSTFALAQNQYYGALSQGRQREEALGAARAAMAYLYRLPERVQLQIKAIQYLDVEQDADKALAVAEMWTQLYPHDADAYQQKALFLYIRNDLAGAVAAYEQSLRIDPSQAEVLRRVAALHRQLGRFDEAEACLRRYAERYPSDVRACTSLADLYEDSGRLAEARQMLEKALLMEPNGVQPRIDLARLDRKEGRFAEARRRLEGVRAEAAAASQRKEALEELMDLCEDEGRPGDAVALMDDWLAAAREVHNPVEVSILRSLFAQRLARAGRPAEALAAIGRIEAETAAPLEGLVGLGRVVPLLDLGRVAEAETALVRAEEVVERLSLGLWRPRLELARGLIADAGDDAERAVAAYRAGLEASPGFGVLRLRLARSLRTLGETGEAIATLRELLALVPAHPEANLELALLLADRGDRDEARAHLERCLAAWRQAEPDYEPARRARELAASLGSSS